MSGLCPSCVGKPDGNPDSESTLTGATSTCLLPGTFASSQLVLTAPLCWDAGGWVMAWEPLRTLVDLTVGLSVGITQGIIAAQSCMGFWAYAPAACCCGQR